MKKFFKEVDMRSKKAMINFLSNHFRYNTMNSWNASTSYANNLKIHKLGLSSDIENKLFEMIEMDAFYDALHNIIRDFGKNHNHNWQAGFNGKSGGYLVLYMGGSKLSEHRSYCMNCGQKNFKLVPPNMTELTEAEKIKFNSNNYSADNRCGRCGAHARTNYINIPVETFMYSGKSVDMNVDYLDWSMYDLKERVKLVQEFDALCDAVVAEALRIATEYEVEEEEVFVPKIVKTLVSTR